MKSKANGKIFIFCFFLCYYFLHAPNKSILCAHELIGRHRVLDDSYLFHDDLEMNKKTICYFELKAVYFQFIYSCIMHIPAATRKTYRFIWNCLNWCLVLVSIYLLYFLISIEQVLFLFRRPNNNWAYIFLQTIYKVNLCCRLGKWLSQISRGETNVPLLLKTKIEIERNKKKLIKSFHFTNYSKIMYSSIWCTLDGNQHSILRCFVNVLVVIVFQSRKKFSTTTETLAYCLRFSEKRLILVFSAEDWK